jgi:hypothetical protein
MKASETWETASSTICNGSPKWRKQQKIFEKIITEILPNLMKLEFEDTKGSINPK